MSDEIKKDRIITDETLRETASHGSEEYPFCYYYEDIWDFDFHCIDWHWHPEVEFVYVQQGKADFLVGGNRYVLSSGDGIFINSQVIHRFEATDSAIIPNIVFSPVLLVPQGSLIYSRYIRPIIESTTECVIFSAEETVHHCIIETMRSIFAVQGSGTASEMKTAELLLKLWRFLYESILITDCGSMSVHSAQTQAKLQIMMQYIHDNYSGQITLDDIARTVLISKSSVLNIFRTYLHTSPINYVVEYRLKRASKLLVDTENSVCTIAHETGFENIGYFCRRFKKLYGVTPINYRKYYRSAERNSMRNIQSDTNVLSG